MTARHDPGRLAATLLATIETAIVPATRAAVARGNKIFGAALLRKDDLSLVLAEANNEIENPLWHGEIHALKRFYERPARSRPEPRDLVFLSTHEPCPLCLSAIAWAGLDNFYYFFSHEESRDAFAIPHDLRILAEVFGLPPGGYRRQNAFWTGRAIRPLIAALPAAERAPLEARAAAIVGHYQALSDAYQAGKAGNTIPLR
jgi:tRNA(Arg) A34 adenosine deaminase TadA